MAVIDTAAIRTRRTKIEQEIQRHREAITALEAKRGELEIAERVINELAVGGNGSASLFAEPKRESAPENRTRTARVPKPAGIPKMPSMIREALREAHQKGAAGLDPDGLRQFVRHKYWSDVPTEAVGPIAWRMWRRGELQKKDTIYSLSDADRLIANATGAITTIPGAAE